MLFVNQTELIILIVVCAIAAACFFAAITLSVWIMINRQRKQKPARELTGISVDATAAKQIFAPGEEFTCEGLIVNAAYNIEPTTETLTHFEVLTEEEFMHLTVAGAANGFCVIKPNMAEAGKPIVIIRYKDKATHYTVTVEPAEEEQTPAEEAQADVQAEQLDAEEAPAEEAQQPVTEEISDEAEAVAIVPAQTPTQASAAIFVGSGVRYDKSFTAKLIQARDEVKSWYAMLKNELLSYKKVKARMSWKRESFRLGRNVVARFAFRGGTLCIYLPLDPASYEGSKYKVEDAAQYPSYTDTPCMYRLKGERRARYAMELIAALMGEWGSERVERAAEEYYLPYEDTEALIGKGLIKREKTGSAGDIVPLAPAEEVADGVIEEPAEEVPATEDVVEEFAEEAPAELVVEEPAEEAPAEPVAEESGETQTVPPFDRDAVQYDRSFAARLILSSDAIKDWYSELKNELLSYRRVKMRRSWKRESYRFGRKNVVRFSFRGKTLCVYFALDPNEFEGSKYKVEPVEGSATYEDTPCLYRMKNAKRVRYAKELIAMAMGSVGAERNEDYVPEDAYIPYEDTGALIGKGLIKTVNQAPKQIVSQDAAEEIPEAIEEVAIAEAPEVAGAVEVAAEENAVEETAEEVSEEEPAEEPTVEEIAEEEPIEEAEVPEEETTEEPIEEVPEETVLDEAQEEQTEEGAEEEAEVEELSKREIADVQAYEEEAEDEDGIDVVGVMFRRRGRKVYWFDPDGKTWAKGEIALYKSPDNPPQEVIVVDNAKISPSKLHLPLKPLHKVSHRPQTDKK